MEGGGRSITKSGLVIGKIIPHKTCQMISTRIGTKALRAVSERNLFNVASLLWSAHCR
jgi:hypothetical protein